MKKKLIIIHFISIIGYAQSFNPKDLLKDNIRQTEPQNRGNQNEVI